MYSRGRKGGKNKNKMRNKRKVGKGRMLMNGEDDKKSI